MKHLLVPDRSEFSRADWTNLAWILGVGMAVIALLNPVGDFPLNDDWAYGWSVLRLVESGDFRLSDWAASNLATQIVWGALFVKIFGFTFTALRASTLVLAVGGLLALYALLRGVCATPRTSLLAVSCLGLSPTYLQLAHSFNNDVPATALFMISAWLMLSGLRGDSRPTIVVGLAVAIAAGLARQSNFVLLPAYGVAYLVHRGLGFTRVVAAVLPTFAGIGLQLGYASWLERTARAPILYDLQIRVLAETLAGSLTSIARTCTLNVVVLGIYTGLFLTPLIAHVALLRRRRGPFGTLLVAAAAGAAAGFALIGWNVRMPMLGNTLLEHSLGPVAGYGYQAELGRIATAVAGLAWRVATVLGVAGAVVLLCLAMRVLVDVFVSRRQSIDRAAHAFILTAALGYLGAVAALPRQYLFDRYSLPLFPLAVVILALASRDGERPEQVVASTRKRWTRVAAIAPVTLLFPLALVSLAANREHLDAHRLRWTALNQLTDGEGISADRIDGGFEFNGWHFGNQIETCSPGVDRHALTGRARWKDFECIFETWNKEYRIAFVPFDGHEVVATHGMRSWLFGNQPTLLVQKRVSSH